MQHYSLKGTIMNQASGGEGKTREQKQPAKQPGKKK
jgi:hypothetical protein